jgi:hypothetical protein
MTTSSHTRKIYLGNIENNRKSRTKKPVIWIKLYKPKNKLRGNPMKS